MSTPNNAILLVDDSATMLMSLSCLLGDRGYGIVTARDGAEGLALLQGGLRPVLIITDVAMPRMDGITFTGEARKLMRFVPILVLTTQSQRDKRERGKALGATGWLIKPVDVTQLFRILDQVLPPQVVAKAATAARPFAEGGALAGSAAGLSSNPFSSGHASASGDPSAAPSRGTASRTHRFAR